MSTKICTVIGARPQFIKASPLSEVLRENFDEIIIHSGQHYSYSMSDIFFKELNMPKPHYNLAVGSSTHGDQTGTMLCKIEKVFLDEAPDFVLVYGDTNSTLAGALAASKLHIPVIHIEAGLRSFNKKMPEEINRILTDHVSQLLFVPSQVSINNLNNEGIFNGIYEVGDIMYDAILNGKERADRSSKILAELNLKRNSYILSTIHRAENTDDKLKMTNIVSSFSKIEKEIIIPLHPRTKKMMIEYGLEFPSNVKVIEPVGYLDMIQLMQNAFCVLTDSGGIQKEAYYLDVPCVTLREQTEWLETLDVGWNTLVEIETDIIINAINKSNNVRNLPHPNLYGSGDTAQRIVNILLNSTNKEKICAA
jgi:UDP-GlcNAc3NAcA epimerase